ncbi:AGE family epimerase/isomerase [Arenibacter sp. M-2]|uniref:AGE family epimerase/isomerase n=1 Tax=Arenibacter sp. M-2 TaxID=3053612 RepID=UPI002570D9DC|nr:AGE family epimerase/isomerase [Arenibacter sp. M-2]MDL5510509.1 AGE family epimerase/isomerase [Arenibacter sp. M-2]
MKYSKIYKDALLKDVIPFWQKYSIDRQNGGYFSCLDRKGQVYDTDKFIWLLGRQSWTFSMLYNNVEKNEKWLEISKLGIDFIREYGMDSDGNFYFSVTEEGQPLVQPYNIFSDCFAAIAFGQYARATGDGKIKSLANQTYHNILRKKDAPKGVYEKSTGIRPLKGFALPMILSNLVLELEDVLDPEEVEKTINHSIKEVMGDFLQGEPEIIYEYVSLKGKLEDSFNGRLLNPGHGLEAMWFMIDIGARKNDLDLIEKATQVILNILEYSWDKKYGGIFYFMDAKGKPLQQLEWDQKLWWVHLESLVALAKAYQHSRNEKVFKWYQKVHNYTWNNFPDADNGEWFGYLNRQGKSLNTLKGGKWKGCFHVPRSLYQCWKCFEQIENSNL